MATCWFRRVDGGSQPVEIDRWSRPSTCRFRRVGAPSVFADLDVLWCVWGLSEQMSVHFCALSDGFGWFIVVSGSSVSSVAVLYCSRFVLSVPGHLWPVHSALSGTDDASSQRSSQQAIFSDCATSQHFRVCSRWNMLKDSLSASSQVSR